MAGKRKPGLKLLCVYKILMDLSDEQHPLAHQQIIDELDRRYRITAERKSIYADIDILEASGVDIIRTPGVGFYIGSGDFEVAELKLLVDAVQSSRLITPGKSRQLIKKLAALTSRWSGELLERQSAAIIRPKMPNESVYYIVDHIHEALRLGKKIRFRYFDYDVSKNTVLRRDGSNYVQTPLALCWNNDSYYMVAYSDNHDGLANYRVDRMQDVYVSDEDASAVNTERFRLRDLGKRQFSMYGGDIANVAMRFENSLVNVVLDHFGMDIQLFPDGPDHFIIKQDVSVSPVFFGWVFQLDGRAAIVEPESVRTLFTSMLARVRGST